MLKPGGRRWCWSFLTVIEPLSKLTTLTPSISCEGGELVAKDGDSYRYLAESIRMHPDQETLKDDAGCRFESVDYHNLTAGIVALHRGYKF
ncbi:Ubiquinone/menaquinone biosynthesis methyltransferase UbiE [Klebsiella aerogenes]|nr:Ubiquinone/menaquinone biosynthesis methyltransferase UbiE [Klebsiella aerogenes]